MVMVMVMMVYMVTLTLRLAVPIWQELTLLANRRLQRLSCMCSISGLMHTNWETSSMVMVMVMVMMAMVMVMVGILCE